MFLDDTTITIKLKNKKKLLRMNLLNCKKKTQILILAISIIFLTSCANKPEGLKVIPKDVGLVSVIDMYALYKKGNLKELEELSFMRTLKKEVRNEDKRIAKFIDKLVEDPRTSGVDFTKDLYMFYVDKASDEQYFCMSLDIANQKNFAKFIEELLEKSKLEYNLEKEELYKYIILEKEVAIAWDNGKALLLMAKNRASRKNLDLQLETLFELKETNQLTVNKEFTAFYKNKKDVSLWFSTNMLADMPEFNEVKNQFGYNFLGNYVTAHLNFDDEKIKLNTEVFLNAELTAQINKYNIWNNNFNAKILNYLPKESLASTSVAINPSSYYELLKSEENLEGFESSFKSTASFDLEDFVASFKGSLILSLVDFREVEHAYKDYVRVYNKKKTKRFNSWSGESYYEGGYEYKDSLKTKTTNLPIFGMALDLNTDKYVKVLIDKIPESNLQKRDGYYEVKLLDSYKGYMAFNKDIFVFTNDKKSIKTFNEGGLRNESLANSDKASNFNNSGYYTFMNLDYNDYSEEVKKEIEKMQDSKERKMFKIWSDFTQSMEMRMIDQNSAEFVLTTKSGDKNSLNALIELLDTSFKNFSSI